MELYIETLTGTAFELHVSPFETVMSVKSKIQRLEGIPISHQHLIWQSIELEDDFCLQDYNIQSGATLKLVLAMRGGPINTRRIPVEDTALREMAEYMEANREEILDKLPGNSNVTLLVFREGDKLNFFRVVDTRPDGSLTPLSEAIYSPVYNVHGDDDDDDDDEDEEEEAEESLNLEKTEENSKMKEKMDQLRVNMEKISLNKKKKHEKSSIKGRNVAGTRLPGLARTHSACMSKPLNKKVCLPPVGYPQLTEMGAACSVLEMGAAAESLLAVTSKNLPPVITQDMKESAASQVETKRPKSVRSDDFSGASPNTDIPAVLSYPSSASTTSLRRTLLRLNNLPDTSSQLTSARRRDNISLLETLQESPSATGEESNKMPGKRKVSDSNGGLISEGDSLKRSPITSRKDTLLDSFLRPNTTTRRKEFSLEGFSSREARTMSGILRQASIEKIGSSHIGSIVTSASKSRLNNYSIPEIGRISTPESRLMSARMTSSIGDRLKSSPTHRLPPVKTKKKQKRCCSCGKKTGLATSYQCRCGKNFCASHRYAESHDCTFDYKTEGRKLLEQSNPLVSAPKLPKI